MALKLGDPCARGNAQGSPGLWVFSPFGYGTSAG